MEREIILGLAVGVVLGIGSYWCGLDIRTLWRKWRGR
jgi:hypothetical protein